MRIEYPRALYHITSRGNERKEIFFDEEDRIEFLDMLRKRGREGVKPKLYTL